MRDILDERVWSSPGDFGQVVSIEELARVQSVSGGILLIRGSIWTIVAVEIAKDRFLIRLQEKSRRRRESP